jgi:hypothetical protein
MPFRQTAGGYAVVYTTVSLATEIILIVGFGLRVPQDNARIAPIILTVPPLLASWLCGYRKPNTLFPLAVLTTALTIVITLAMARITGITTGLPAPILTRLLAGFLSAWIIHRKPNQQASPNGSRRS